MKAEVFKPKTRSEWLESRSSFLGGSEIATVVGLNPYQTPYQLWLLKTGKEKPFEGNEATEMGNILEPVVAEKFENATGHRVIKASADDVVYINKHYPFLAGTPDRFYFPSEKDGRRVLECKTTSMPVDADSIPQMWYAQTTFYMGLTGTQKGHIAWLSGNRGFKYGDLPIELDSEVYDLLVQAGVEFWNEHVVKDLPPDAVNIEDVQRQYRSHTEGKIVDVDSTLYTQHVQLAALKQEKKLIEERISQYEDSIKMAYADSEGMRYEGQILSTWKQAKGSERLNTKKLQSEMPQVYQRYAEQSEGSRRFLIKL